MKVNRFPFHSELAGFETSEVRLGTGGCVADEQLSESSDNRPFTTAGLTAKSGYNGCIIYLVPTVRAFFP